MSDALRHTLRKIDLPGGGTMSRMEIDAEGEWVSYDDYQAAIERAERAEAENARLERVLATTQKVMCDHSDRRERAEEALEAIAGNKCWFPTLFARAAMRDGEGEETG